MNQEGGRQESKMKMKMAGSHTELSVILMEISHISNQSSIIFKTSLSALATLSCLKKGIMLGKILSYPRVLIANKMVLHKITHEFL